jgi:LacI family transcriptional regulator
MSTPPPPKYLQIARQLEAAIQAGRWEKGKLPSVRVIAEEHRVSVVTASRALQILRDKRLINTVDRSGCCLVPPQASQAECWALCLRVTPGAWTQAVAYVTRAGFDAVARQQGLILDTETFASRDGVTERACQLQVRAARGAGVAGLFLLPSRHSEPCARQDEVLVQACHSQGLPVVVIERNLRGHDRPLGHDLVCSDDTAGAAECPRHLIDQGRRRIAFVTGSPTSSHDARLAGYLYALFRYAPACQRLEPAVLEQRAGLPSKAAFQELADQLLHTRVDGVVCYQDYTAVGIILELLTRGVRVPRDVAVTGFDDLPVGNSFAIGVTTYASPLRGGRPSGLSGDA